jgi:hypothetical protein
VAGGSFDRTLYVAKSNLHGIVTIDILGLDLGNHTGTHLKHCARIVFTIRIKDAGHSDFFAN